jgi:hypothetical protein
MKALVLAFLAVIIATAAVEAKCPAGKHKVGGKCVKK